VSRDAVRRRADHAIVAEYVLDLSERHGLAKRERSGPLVRRARVLAQERRALPSALRRARAIGSASALRPWRAGELAPLTVSGPLGMVSELGSPAASVWLFAPCRLMIWGVLPPVSSGAPDR
jgi:hypothetical protein